MRRWILLSFLGLLFATVGLTDAVAAAAQANWTTLGNCQLNPNPANDGDSFHVLCNGREFIFRLYFVDTPETDNSIPKRVDEQAAYFRISKQSALAVGLTAKQFSATRLSGSFIVITRWEDAKGRSRLPRSYAFVRVNGHDLGEALVESGLARIYGARTRLPDGTTSANERTKLQNLERQAKIARRGAWAYSTNVTNAALPPKSTSSQKSASASGKPKQTSAATTNRTSDAATTQYRISSGGIRHNSSCRYFNGVTTRPRGPDDGRPCKICGG
jgi:endonuclease YncB( thermonuclease family)